MSKLECALKDSQDYILQQSLILSESELLTVFTIDNIETNASSIGIMIENLKMPMSIMPICNDSRNESVYLFTLKIDMVNYDLIKKLGILMKSELDIRLH